MGKRKAVENEVIVVSKKQRIRADRDKLARHSQYFAALFSTNFKDHEQQEFEIKYDVSLPTLQIFVDWCNDDGENGKIFSSSEYHFDVRVSLKHFLKGNREQLLELLNLSVLFSADKLTEDLTQIIICTRLGPEVMLDVWLLAENLGLTVLRDIAFATCLDRFEEITMPRLLELSKADFFRLVNNMNVHCSADHMLFVRKAWIKEDNGLKKGLSDDGSDVKADEEKWQDKIQLTDWYFKAKADKTPADNNKFETSDAKCLKEVYEAIRPDFMPCSAGRKLDGSLFVLAWNPEIGKMQEIAESGDLQKRTDTNNRFSRNRDHRKNELVGSRRVVGRAFSIYVIVGSMKGTGRFARPLIWRYCLFSKKWYIEAILPRPREHMAVAFLKNKLYLFGGMGFWRTELSSVDVYDIYTGKWSEAADIPVTFTEVRDSFVVYGMFGYWKTGLNIFNPINNEWNKPNLPLESRVRITQSGVFRKLVAELTDVGFFSAPWIVMFGYGPDRPYVRVTRLNCKSCEVPRFGDCIISYDVAGKALTNVDADCFTTRLGCFDIINPQSLHRAIPSVLFKLCSEVSAEVKPRPRRKGLRSSAS